MSKHSKFQEVVQCDSDFSGTPFDGWGVIIATPDQISTFMNAESLAKQFSSTNKTPSTDHTMLRNAIHAVKESSIAQASEDGTKYEDLSHLKVQWEIMMQNLGNGVVSFDEQATIRERTRLPKFLQH